ncbi:unnamed protein product [Cercospora beticola]|nr:unnamed protein product [Cercospora beticola]
MNRYPPSTIFVTALTTPFSPAADCFGSTYSIADGSNDTTDSTVIGTPGITFSTLRHGYTSSCYPEGGLSAIFEPPYYGGWFEPGYCPNGFTTVSAKITNGATTAVCCPSSWSLDTIFGGERVYCARTGSATLSVDGGSISVTDYIAQGVRGFKVRQESRYETVFASLTGVTSSASASSTNSNTVSPGASVHSTPASTSAGTSTPDPPGPSLSTGAKAGIGVGASLGALLLVVGILLFFRRRNQAQKARTGPSSRADGHAMPELSEADWTGADPDFYGNEGSKARQRWEGLMVVG